MQIEKYTDNRARKVFYFHGVPGSPAEVAMFDQAVSAQSRCIISFKRFSIDPAISSERYYQLLADQVLSISKGQKIDLIGFSIGCHVAIEVALLLKQQLASLHLISAAAPLEGGNFLPGMAGAAVFKLAQKAPVLFTVLSYWQRLLARFVPKLLCKMLFASARGQDRILAESAEFQKLLLPILAESFSADISGYIRDVKAYVAPWREQLGKLQVNTYLYHGQSDNWSPLAMAHYLRDAITAECHLQEYPGLSHYSCLQAAIKDIFQQLERDEMHSAKQ
ncbi:MAG: alpha/beta hydrolase [Pseudomonadales bacterium]|nr:alpha/beta hydrolase [Pseudomonadales bacterium]NRA15366.1 alpha/beta hydrolase [Oceanospirillaceae bacterium]